MAQPAVKLHSQCQKFIRTMDHNLIPSGRRRKNPFELAAEAMMTIPGSPKDALKALGDFFISMPEPLMRTLPDEVVTGYDNILAEQLKNGGEITTDDQTMEAWQSTLNFKPKYPVCVWQGDITRLRVEAAVTAANTQLLGCFLPSHRCLDNIIFRSAGPRLRMACQDVKDKLDIDEDDNGQCRVTPAFQMPSKFIFHTAGPNLCEYKGYTRPPNATDRKELISSYETCLREASKMGCASIAFPCISTGVFGYPADEATGLAMSTVKKLMNEFADKKEHVPKVIFNVFLDKDLRIYEQYFPQVFGEESSSSDSATSATSASATSASASSASSAASAAVASSSDAAAETKKEEEKKEEVKQDEEVKKDEEEKKEEKKEEEVKKE